VTLALVKQLTTLVMKVLFLLEQCDGNVNQMESGQIPCHRVLVSAASCSTQICSITFIAEITVELANESFSIVEGNTVRRVCVVKTGSAPVSFDVIITPVVTSPTEAICKS